MAATPATTSQHNNAGHIRKRPYQPSITSYFNSRDANTSRTAGLTSPLSPPLPAETQASLLSVGMRVRKSVPEGYKTHKTLGGVGFPFSSTAPSLSAATSTGEGGSSSGASARELMPFCGLHKTGGWAAQEVVSSSAPAVMQPNRTLEEEDMGVPGLIMSQSTLPSTQGSFVSSDSAQPGSRKRTYEEETEEEIDAYFDGIGADEAAEQQMMREGRRIAKMKGRSDWPGKGRPAGAVRVVGVDDFEEAAFLAPLDVDEA